MSYHERDHMQDGWDNEDPAPAKTKAAKCNSDTKIISSLVAVLNTVLRGYELKSSDYHTAVSAVQMAESRLKKQARKK